MMQQRLPYCCSATWIYGVPQNEPQWDRFKNTYVRKSPEEFRKTVKEQVEAAVEERRRDPDTWGRQQSWFMLVVAGYQMNHEGLLEGLKDAGFTCISAGYGAHNTPNYLFVKQDKPIDVPEAYK